MRAVLLLSVVTICQVFGGHEFSDKSGGFLGVCILIALVMDIASIIRGGS